MTLEWPGRPAVNHAQDARATTGLCQLFAFLLFFLQSSLLILVFLPRGKRPTLKVDTNPS